MRGRHTGISSQKPCVPSPETSTTPRCSQACSSVWGWWPSHTLAVSIAALQYKVYLLVRYSCPKLFFFFSLSEFDIRHFSCLMEWREGEAKTRQHTRYSAHGPRDVPRRGAKKKKGVKVPTRSCRWEWIHRKPTSQSDGERAGRLFRGDPLSSAEERIRLLRCGWERVGAGMKMGPKRRSSGPDCRKDPREEWCFGIWTRCT